MTTPEDNQPSRIDVKRNSCPCCEGSALPFHHPWPILLSMAITVVSALFYLADTVLDCILAYNYKHDSIYEQTEDSDDHPHLLARSNRFRVYFWLTLTFLLFPAIMVWVGFVADTVRDRNWLRLLGTPMFLTGLVPAFGYCGALAYKLMLLVSPNDVKKAQKEIKQEVQKAEVASIGLRFIEKTSEAAPQLVFQLFVMLFEQMLSEDYQRKNSWDSIPTIYYFTTISSLVSVAWAVTSLESYAKEHKHSKTDTVAGKFLLFFWHLFFVCTRVSAIILAAHTVWLAIIFMRCLQRFTRWFCLAHTAILRLN